MTKITHPGFANDTRIIGVGNYFRPIGGGKWRVALKILPEQKRNSFSASKASLAVRGRVINPDKEKDTKG